MKMSVPLFLTAISIAAAAGPSALAQEMRGDTLVVTKQGTLKGASFGGGRVYYDVPYAAAPTGVMRWKPPAPARSWSGTRDATRRGAACVQPDQGWNAGDAARGSEDCLYLNIWVPRHRAGEVLPVMVWFHGGAFVGGAGNTPLYDGEEIARRGVILVTVNYRLGIFGYLSHPDLAAESGRGRSGNYGLLDQIAALRWIKQTIAAFGGDSGNVTIFGQSAGSASVGLLMASPLAKGLMARAILESGPPFGALLGRLPRLEDAEATDRRLGDIAALRQLDPRQLVSLWDRRQNAEDKRLGPVVDGYAVPQEPARSYGSGAAAGLSVLLGYNTREFPGTTSPDALEKELASVFGGNAGGVRQFYTDRVDRARYGSVSDQLSTDTMFGCGTVRLAEATGRAWLYEFAQPSPGEPMVRHSSELPYVFGNANKDGKVLSSRSFNPEEAALSRLVIDYWTNFAKTGDPNGPGLVKWPLYNAARGERIRLSVEPSVVSGPGSPACPALLATGQPISP
jgi:para-nitrobenzyl esterase